MNEYLHHWYDGWFYDYFIASNQDKAFMIVKDLMNTNSTLLDVGCGTGRFCFLVNDKCSMINGVDASIKNINIANKNYDLNLHKKIKFYHNDIKSFIEKSNTKYDYALLSYVIHEIDEAKRIDLLKILSLYAEKIIIVDYLAPHPKSILGIINRAVEFLAGVKHNRNFKSFLKNNGIKGLANRANLKIITDIKNNPPTSNIIVLSKE
jgi:2-polyprenyl-3-methyl-5-hydroxy-6-metoxy-1,4-benzoquinol methylase